MHVCAHQEGVREAFAVFMGGFNHAHVCVWRLFTGINISGVCLHAQYHFGKLSFTKIYTQMLSVCIPRGKECESTCLCAFVCVCRLLSCNSLFLTVCPDFKCSLPISIIFCSRD